MDVSQVIQPAGATTAQPVAANKGAVSSDFETFLKMLTVQMQNQDPLNPVDSSDYAVQLATFSGVEQQVLTNQLLEGLAAQMGASGMAQMASWVGKDARAISAAQFDGAPITVSTMPALVSSHAELIVRDSAGDEVQRLGIPVVSGPIEWAGVANNGTPFPPGIYSFHVASHSGDSLLMEEQAEVYGSIREVRAEGGQTLVVLPGGIEVPSTAVTALRDPSAIRP